LPAGKPPNNMMLRMDIYMDSTLVVNQLNGHFKVKDATLRQLLATVRILEQEVSGEVRYFIIPRERNRQADLLVNNTLDKLLMSS